MQSQSHPQTPSTLHPTPPPPALVEIQCYHCFHTNPGDARNCAACGRPLYSPPPIDSRETVLRLVLLAIGLLLLPVGIGVIPLAILLFAVLLTSPHPARKPVSRTTYWGRLIAVALLILLPIALLLGVALVVGLLVH